MVIWCKISVWFHCALLELYIYQYCWFRFKSQFSYAFSLNLFQLGFYFNVVCILRVQLLFQINILAAGCTSYWDVHSLCQMCMFKMKFGNIGWNSIRFESLDVEAVQTQIQISCSMAWVDTDSVSIQIQFRFDSNSCCIFRFDCRSESPSSRPYWRKFQIDCRLFILLILCFSGYNNLVCWVVCMMVFC